MSNAIKDLIKRSLGDFLMTSCRGFAPIAGLSMLALASTLTACSEDNSEPADQGIEQSSPDDEHISDADEDNEEPQDDEQADVEEGETDEHTPVDESETEEPSPVALDACQLIRPDVPTRIFGQEFDEPVGSDNGASCLWESPGSDGDYIELESATASAEDWEALRQDLGVTAELSDYGDDAFIDDESIPHIWFEDVSVAVTAAVNGSGDSQQEEVLEEVSINLEELR